MEDNVILCTAVLIMGAAIHLFLANARKAQTPPQSSGVRQVPAKHSPGEVQRHAIRKRRDARDSWHDDSPWLHSSSPERYSNHDPRCNPSTRTPVSCWDSDGDGGGGGD
jgi:hypothetical protein